MSSPAQTPPPKASRAKHQHSKSATPAPSSASGKPTQKHKKNKRNNQNINNTALYEDNQLDGISNQSNHFVPYGTLQGQYTNFFPPNEESDVVNRGKNGNRYPQRSPKRASPQPVPQSSTNGYTEGKVSSPYQNANTPGKMSNAYAGPTFHASPAPSALPMPKFFSKSVPASASEPSLQTRLDVEEDSNSASDPPSPSPSSLRPPVVEPPRNQVSPLEFFFKADRAEKARQNSVQGNGSPAPLSPPVELSASQPSRRPDMHHSRQESHGSGKGIFMMELDASEPASRTPRPSGTPTNNRSVTAPSAIPQSTKTANSEADSQAIKDLLLSLTQSRPNLPTPLQNGDRIPSEPSSRYHTPSPFNQARASGRAASGPTTPAPQQAEASESPFHYGNRNLSPLFKAASRPESAKRSSSLRTEVTANSPTAAQSQFPSLSSPGMRAPHTQRPDAVSVPHNYLNTILTPPGRSPAPNFPAYHAPFQAYSGPGSGHVPHQAPPNTYHWDHASPPSTSSNFSNPAITSPASTASTNSSYTAKSPDPEAMAMDLKRMLNINAVTTRGTAGIR